MSRLGLIVATALLTAACTPAARYEFVRATGEAKARCEALRTAAAEASCRDDYRLSYEDYESMRHEAGSSPRLERSAGPVP